MARWRAAGIVLAACAAFWACAAADPPFEPEEHFTFELIDGGNAVRVTGYAGTGTDLNVPPRIGGLPVTAIGDRAFEGRGLTSLILPETVTRIGNGAFAENRLARLSLPTGTAYIGSGAFTSNRLRRVVLPRGLVYIGTVAFADNRLSRIEIPAGTEHIGEGAFQWNEISRAVVPRSVTYIGDQAFANNRLARMPVASEAPPPSGEILSFSPWPGFDGSGSGEAEIGSSVAQGTSAVRGIPPSPSGDNRPPRVEAPPGPLPVLRAVQPEPRIPPAAGPVQAVQVVPAFGTPEPEPEEEPEDEAEEEFEEDAAEEDTAEDAVEEEGAAEADEGEGEDGESPSDSWRGYLRPDFMEADREADD